MKINRKYKNPGQMNPTARIRAGRTGECLFFKSIYHITMLLLMMIVLQSLNNNNDVDAKAFQRTKKTLKLLQSSSSTLIKLRHKRDTFANEQQQDDQYYDVNYEVLPNSNSQPPSMGDQISETAKQVAQSFTNMWQSLTESIRHCIDALRGLFGNDVSVEDDVTPEQEQQLLVAMEQQYRVKHERDNEVLMNVK